MSFDRLPSRRAGIDTYQQPVVYMRSDCPVCRAKCFEAQTQVEVIAGHRHVLAILNHVASDWLRSDEIALSEAAWTMLGMAEGEEVEVRHPPQLDSLAHLRAKVHGGRLGYEALRALMDDVSHGRVSDIHLASFVTMCAGGGNFACRGQALHRRPARKSDHTAGGADRRGLRYHDAQDIVARHHFGGRDSGCDGNAGTRRSGPVCDAPRGTWRSGARVMWRRGLQHRSRMPDRNCLALNPARGRA
jgi:hypothetical protein